MFNDTSKLFENTTPINRRKATEAMKAFYKYCGQDEPEVVIVDGPDHLGMEIDWDDEGFSFFDHKNLAQFVTKRGSKRCDRLKVDLWSIFDLYRRPPKMKSKYFGSEAVLMPEDYEYGQDFEWSRYATALWDESYLSINFKKKSFILDRPEVCLANDRGLHCDDGPALVFRDGSEFFFWNSERFERDWIFDPEKMTLKDIHVHNSRKHINIAFVGVERYLDMCKAWKVDVRGKFKKFGSFERMVVPGDDEIKQSWKKKGYGHHNIDEPYCQRLTKGSVNGERGLIIKNPRWDSLYHFTGSPFDTNHYSDLFNDHDRELWEVLDIDEMFMRGAINFDITYQKVDPNAKQLPSGSWESENGKDVFRAYNHTKYGDFKALRHDCVPSWFKAQMFLGNEAEYHDEDMDYGVRFKDGELEYTDNVTFSSTRFLDDPPLVFSEPIFKSHEKVPYYMFDIDLSSDTWEGLLEKWAYKAFDWLGMHEDSSRG